MTVLTATDFLGEWQLSRVIDDRHGGLRGTMEGAATFVEVKTDVLAYSEEGDMRYGSGPVLRAQRRYGWAFDDGGVAVTFENGDPFHHFVPQGQGAGTDHPCGADFYQVRYDFRAWPKWMATWAVTGPRKDYTSISTYTRG